jgi:hypothetical protein
MLFGSIDTSSEPMGSCAYSFAKMPPLTLTPHLSFNVSESSPPVRLVTIVTLGQTSYSTTSVGIRAIHEPS